jgi:hypothetical protein
LVNTVEIEPIEKDLLAEIIEVQSTDQLAVDSLRQLTTTAERTIEPTTELSTDAEHDWAVSAGALTFNGEVYVRTGSTSFESNRTPSR